MRYVSLDLETTGLDPVTCQVLQIAMVLEDTEDQIPVNHLPRLNLYVRHEKLTGASFALAMNTTILKILSGTYVSSVPIFSQDGAVEKIQEWLRDIFGKKKITLAGKNVASFDLPFLTAMGVPNEIFSHRYLDPGPMFFDPCEDDIPPNLKICLERAGYVGDVSHDALDDARDVIRCIRYATERLTRCK